jgi:succinate-semialdehyde dehydrogenase/glutarate-semialdehyde dehydrogenase
MAIASVNPATDETVRTFVPLNGSQIEVKLQKASDAFRSWKRPFPERAALMIRASEILEAGSADFSRLMALETGKLYQAGVDEAKKCTAPAGFTRRMPNDSSRTMIAVDYAFQCTCIDAKDRFWLP